MYFVHFGVTGPAPRGDACRTRLKEKEGFLYLSHPLAGCGTLMKDKESV